MALRQKEIRRLRLVLKNTLAGLVFGPISGPRIDFFVNWPIWSRWASQARIPTGRSWNGWPNLAQFLPCCQFNSFSVKKINQQPISIFYYVCFFYYHFAFRSSTLTMATKNGEDSSNDDIRLSPCSSHIDGNRQKSSYGNRGKSSNGNRHTIDGDDIVPGSTSEELPRTAAPTPASSDSAVNCSVHSSSALLSLAAASTTALAVDPDFKLATSLAVDPDFKLATFNDVTLDSTGTLIGIFGTPWTSITAKDLRPLARDLHVRRYANMKKSALVEAIQSAYTSTGICMTPKATNNQPARGSKRIAPIDY